jgi:hypothetical protein
MATRDVDHWYVDGDIVFQVSNASANLCSVTRTLTLF